MRGAVVMKKWKKLLWLFWALPAVFSLSVLYLFMDQRSTQAREQNYPVTRVSVILPHKDDGYWELIADGIEEAKEEIGDQYHIDIDTMIPQLNYNIGQMTDLLKQQAAAQVDVIVVQGNENEEFRSALLDAYEQGIQIICVDTDLTDFPEHLYIGTDNYAAGRMIGEELAALCGGKVKAAVISGEPGYLNLEQRLAGLEDVVADYPEIELGEVKYDNYDGLTVMRLYHELCQDAEAVVFLEGTGGKTLESLLTESDQEYQYVLGFDAFEGSGNSILDGIVKQDTNQMGRRVVEEIAHYIENGSYSSDTIYTDIDWLTADNYDSVMQKQGR